MPILISYPMGNLPFCSTTTASEHQWWRANAKRREKQQSTTTAGDITSKNNKNHIDLYLDSRVREWLLLSHIFLFSKKYRKEKKMYQVPRNFNLMEAPAKSANASPFHRLHRWCLISLTPFAHYPYCYTHAHLIMKNYFIIDFFEVLSPRFYMLVVGCVRTLHINISNAIFFPLLNIWRVRSYSMIFIQQKQRQQRTVVISFTCNRF